MPSGAFSGLEFRELVRTRGAEVYRDLPWRRTRDPYAVLVSEVMLQQTQVSRVLGRWEAWLDEFPTIDALSAASTSRVLSAWQGMGYNRRALALKHAADECAVRHGGQVPSSSDELLALPGIGPSTAAGVRIFAFGMPDVYIETNVRAVVIHECFPDAERVPDSAIAPILREACDPADPRTWYYAMLDYGAWLKKAFPNPARASSAYARQSAFEGSKRQKRAALLRAVLDEPRSTAALAGEISGSEAAAGRPPLSEDAVSGLLGELSDEGFIAIEDGIWKVRG